MMKASEVLGWFGLAQGSATKSHILEINRAADEGGTIPPEDMRELFPNRPGLHTHYNVRLALLEAGCLE